MDVHVGGIQTAVDSDLSQGAERAGIVRIPDNTVCLIHLLVFEHDEVGGHSRHEDFLGAYLENGIGGHDRHEDFLGS